MAPPPLYDKWYVLAEMASVPSQLVDEVEPVLGPADEKGAADQPATVRMALGHFPRDRRDDGLDGR